jgi:hypothetical protein
MRTSRPQKRFASWSAAFPRRFELRATSVQKNRAKSSVYWTSEKILRKNEKLSPISIRRAGSVPPAPEKKLPQNAKSYSSFNADPI